MLEAQNSEYFVDGFFIRHFKKFPLGCNQEEFFEEQKIFLMFLIGTIPEFSDWNLQIKYYQEKHNIDIMTINDIKLSDYDKDVAAFQGKDINEIKKEKLKVEKRKLKSELNKKYGVEDKNKVYASKSLTDNDSIQNDNDDVENTEKEQKRLWDILELRGLTKENG